jgi:hypothetical protein
MMDRCAAPPGFVIRDARARQVVDRQGSDQGRNTASWHPSRPGWRPSGASRALQPSKASRAHHDQVSGCRFGISRTAGLPSLAASGNQAHEDGAPASAPHRLVLLDFTGAEPMGA